MNIISMSFGKDSTAMLLKMIERKESIHSILWFDTERDFTEILKHAQKLIRNTGIDLITVRDYIGFNFWEKRYGKAHPSGGWCTALKRNACNKYIRLMLKDNPNMIECIGYTTDELKRAEKTTKAKKWNVRYPLIEYRMSEKDCLEYCYSKGYDFGNIYNWMPSQRVSCYDCPKQSKADWIAIKKYHPELFNPCENEKLKEIKEFMERSGKVELMAK